MIINTEGPVWYGAEFQVTVRVQMPRHPELVFWYRFPESQLPRLTRWADPFVLAVIFLAMKRGEDVVVKGRVSPSLLENLERFQEIWSCWRPDVYSRVNISADQEIEEVIGDEKSAIALYSGGVDAAFSMLKHVRSDMGRLSRRIDTGLMVCGMGGFQHGAEVLFDEALSEARSATSVLGVPIDIVTTNWQQVMLSQGLNVYDIHPTGFIACMHLFRVGCGAGIFSSSESTQHYSLADGGSNPLTDPLLATKNFRILHEGSGYTRTEKIRYLTAWPGFFKRLRVCNRSIRTTRNCGVCEKCIRTALAFRIIGIELPDGLSQPTLEQVAAIHIASPTVNACVNSLLLDARNSGLEGEEWVRQLAMRVESYSRAY